MITPFDATLRLRQREMDAMRILISVEVNQLMVIERSRDAIDVSVRHETAIAATDWGCTAHPFIMRMRAQRETLSRERASIDSRLIRLRHQAAEAYGALRAIDSAAGRFRAEAVRVASVAEQGRIDDFSAARFTRVQGESRRSRHDAERDA